MTMDGILGSLEPLARVEETRWASLENIWNTYHMLLLPLS